MDYAVLADVLAGRKTAGELTGQVLVGGKRPSRMFMRRYTGYVEQFGGAANLCRVGKEAHMHAAAAILAVL